MFGRGKDKWIFLIQNLEKLSVSEMMMMFGGGGGENHHLLEVGKEYTLEDIDVHSWHTIVYIKEFPNVEFNSVVFKEIEN